MLTIQTLANPIDFRSKEIEVEVDRKDLQLLHESGRIAKVSGLAKREDGKYLYKKYGVSEASAATIGKDRKARLVMPMLLVVVKQQEEVYLARSSREWYHRPATEEEVACADRTAELNEDRRLETVRDGEEPERVVEGPHQFRHKMLKISTLLINQANIFKVHSRHLEKIEILKDSNSQRSTDYSAKARLETIDHCLRHSHVDKPPLLSR
ncbi:hypothetical protein HZH66_011375 [Vespula vulgaris]|uniref:Uncharacterized protein n=1 Tax=Vespula vulgaris TaxID=7454 RepID=A0A834JE34_VESVU|nr:hypothetical protein HZH66_011375 [Vespula vulgaris]